MFVTKLFTVSVLELPYNANRSQWKTFTVFVVLLLIAKVFQQIFSFYNKVLLGLKWRIAGQALDLAC